MGLVVTVVSKDIELANAIANSLKNLNLQDDDEPTIQTLEPNSYIAPTDNRPLISNNFENNITCHYYFDDNSNDIEKLKILSQDYTSRVETFLKGHQEKKLKVELNTFESPPVSPRPDYNALLEDIDKKVENQNSKKAMYCFTAGIVLCASSGILFLFAAPALLTIPAIVLGLLLIGMSYYFDRDLESTADKACENIFSCTS